MISFEQVLLLEEKVESAVAKIAQLNAENAALRRKCAELTNALSAKTEQFSSFQADQDKIEAGILKALSRLDAVENAVLSSVELAPEPAAASEDVSEPVFDADSETVSGTEDVPEGVEPAVDLSSEPAPEISENTENVSSEKSAPEADEPAIRQDDAVPPSADDSSEASPAVFDGEDENSPQLFTIF